MRSTGEQAMAQQASGTRYGRLNLLIVAAVGVLLGVARSPEVGAAAVAATALIVFGIVHVVVRRMLTSARAASEAAAAEVAHHGMHDRLTGLPNRDAFISELTESVAAGEPLAVAVIDLNRFKLVNDTLGHRAGDELLVTVARRLTSVVNVRSMVARLGGDEFAIILRPAHGPPTMERAIARAEQIATDLMSEPAMLDGIKVPVEAAFGLALLEPHQDPVSVLARADMAMYAAKRSGTGAVRVFTPEMERDNVRELALAAELGDAIGSGQIVAYFQPKFAAETLELIGAEVLARWKHPTLGLLNPGAFTHLVDVSDKVGKFTRCMLALGLDAAAKATRLGVELPVAVNVSVRALLEPGFASAVASMCVERDVAPNLLTIELTESEVMDPSGLASAVLHELTATGVKLSIDDFGTGYSSFARLSDLPINEVKIDQSFIHKVPDKTTEAIVRAITEMSHGLGFRVIVEGVESAEQFRFLTGLDGSVNVQGYLFGRPVPFARLVSDHLVPKASDFADDALPRLTPTARPDTPGIVGG